MKKTIIAVVSILTIAAISSQFAFAKGNNANDNSMKNDAIKEKLKGYEKERPEQGNAQIYKHNSDTVVDGLEIAGEIVEDGSAYNPEQEQVAEEIQEIADEQEDIGGEVAEAIEALESRNRWRTLLFGTDYKNLGQLRSNLVRNENQIRKLTKNTQRVEGEEEQQMLQEQLATMTQERERIKTVIEDNESQLSILGWIKKIFVGYDDEPLDTEEEDALLDEVAETIDEEDIATQEAALEE